jgi:para-aminobenzoate synthetase component 2
MISGPHILVIDNYDSFVYNLVQYLGELGAVVTVVRNDQIEAHDIGGREVDGVLISPGPGHPRSAGNCLAVIRYCAQHSLPMLGICLGHQALGEAYGANITAAPELVHGRSSRVDHEQQGVFAGVASPLVAGRYHSLVVDASSLPDDLVITATSGGLIMGMRHRDLPLEGIQFHPESILTQDGYRLLANWLATCGSNDAVERSTLLNERSNAVRQALPHTADVK